MGSVPADDATTATVRKLARERGLTETEVVAEAIQALLDRQGVGETDADG